MLIAFSHGKGVLHLFYLVKVLKAARFGNALAGCNGL